jgi:hypothetical protein
VRYGTVLYICRAAVLRASLVSLFVAVLLFVAGILLRDLWRAWMHGGEGRGSGAGGVFVVVGGKRLGAKGSAVSLAEIGRMPWW